MEGGISYYITFPYKNICPSNVPKDHPTNRLKFDQCYYVDMPQNLIVIEEQLKEIVNLDEVIHELV
jgi:hypothetical protein